MSDTVTAVDLFAGAGGASCGLMQAGIDVVAAVEWDAWAALTYAVNLCRPGVQFHCLTDEDQARLDAACGKLLANSGGRCVAGTGWIRSEPTVRGCRHVIVGDIRLLSGRLLLEALGMRPGELGLMAMSPPCQGFSTANSRRARDFQGDARNDLCFEAGRLIVECQPKTWHLENVPAFRKSPQYALFRRLLGGGEDAVAAFAELLPHHPHWALLLDETIHPHFQPKSP